MPEDRFLDMLGVISRLPQQDYDTILSQVIAGESTPDEVIDSISPIFEDIKEPTIQDLTEGKSDEFKTKVNELVSDLKDFPAEERALVLNNVSEENIDRAIESIRKDKKSFDESSTLEKIQSFRPSETTELIPGPLGDPQFREDLTNNASGLLEGILSFIPGLNAEASQNEPEVLPIPEGAQELSSDPFIEQENFQAPGILDILSTAFEDLRSSTRLAPDDPIRNQLPQLSGEETSSNFQRNAANLLQSILGTQGQIPDDIDAAGTAIQAPATPETNEIITEATQDVDTGDFPEIEPTSSQPVVDATPEPTAFDRQSQLKQAQQALLAASVAGTADEQDYQDYIAVTNQLGEVPSFTNRKGTPGFYLPAEGQIPTLKTFSLENPTESLIEAEKYMGELSNAKAQVAQQASKLFNSQQQIMSELQATLQEMQTSNSDIRKNALSSQARGLQDQLNLAIKQDDADRQRFIQQNAGDLDAQIETTTRQMAALQLKQQQDFRDFQTGKGGAPSEEVSRLVSLDLPAEDKTGDETFRQLDKGRKDRYINLAIEARNTFINQIDFSTSGLDLLAKNEIKKGNGRDETALSQIDNIKRQGILAAEKEIQSEITRREATGRLSPEERDVIRKQIARQEVNKRISAFGRDSMVDNVDWFAVPGNQLTLDLIEDVKKSNPSDYKDVIGELVTASFAKYGADQSKALIDRMLIAFNNNFNDTYSVYGVKFDSTKAYERYQNSFFVRLRRFLLGR